MARFSVTSTSTPAFSQLMEILADRRHYLRVHFFVTGGPARCWRIIFALREMGAHVKGETAIAFYDMQWPEQVPESATVY